MPRTNPHPRLSEKQRPDQVARKPTRRGVEPTTIQALDRLAEVKDCTLEQYISAASEYVRRQRELNSGQRKAGQIRLSNALGKAFASDLRTRLSRPLELSVGERRVAGALRPVNADVSEIHATDGLRLAVELKPVNLAVGRAIWNRFGDIRTFAVNLHLKFPFCVIGGVLAIPTWEEVGTKQAQSAAAEEAEHASEHAEETAALDEMPGWKSTRHLIERAIARLVRAGGRRTEADAPHLLEAIAVVVYDPKTGALDDELPSSASGLRWNDFVAAMASAYDARFED
jgi:hypothetical protein